MSPAGPGAEAPGSGPLVSVLVAGALVVAALAVVVHATPGPGRSTGPGATGVAEIATVDDRGSFSVPCAPSHTAPDDPIVHRDHAGGSHLHEFFGATSTDASSTAATLRAGGTTCRSVADTSAYWVPALLADGERVPPAHLIAYYRAPVGADPRDVVAPPNGLAMVAGDAAAERPQDPAVVRWRCGPGGPASAVPIRCERRAELRLQVTFPTCWDGDRLRAADHRSHVVRLPGSEAERQADGASCPPSHPVLLPELTIEVRYRDVPDGELGLASGPATGGHGDVLVAWDEPHLAAEVATCIGRSLTCDIVSESARLGVG